MEEQTMEVQTVEEQTIEEQTTGCLVMRCAPWNISRAR